MHLHLFSATASFKLVSFLLLLLQVTRTCRYMGMIFKFIHCSILSYKKFHLSGPIKTLVFNQPVISSCFDFKWELSTPTTVKQDPWQYPSWYVVILLQHSFYIIAGTVTASMHCSYLLFLPAACAVQVKYMLYPLNCWWHCESPSWAHCTNDEVSTDGSTKLAVMRQ